MISILTIVSVAGIVGIESIAGIDSTVGTALAPGILSSARLQLVEPPGVDLALLGVVDSTLGAEASVADLIVGAEASAADSLVPDLAVDITVLLLGVTTLITTL